MIGVKMGIPYIKIFALYFQILSDCLVTADHTNNHTDNQNG